MLVTCHRRENYYDGNIESVCAAIRKLAERPDVQVAFTVHQNPKVREPVSKALSGALNVTLLDPQDYLPFIYLMTRAHFIISDSGGIQEEAPSLGKPVLIMRNVTERPEAIACGSAKLVGTDARVIYAEAARLLDNTAAYQRMSAVSNPFGDGQAARRIAEVLAHGH